MGSDREQVTSEGGGQLHEKVGSARNTNERNIVLTGPGRSGTTLTCHLLNKLPNTVALAEPLTPGRFEEQMPDIMKKPSATSWKRLLADAPQSPSTRAWCLANTSAASAPDNTKGKVDGVRQRIAVKGNIPVGKNLDRDFFLAIKAAGNVHPALLPHLAKRFPCYAIVRNPLGNHSLGWQHTVEKEGQEPNCTDEVRRGVPSPGPTGI